MNEKLPEAALHSEMLGHLKGRERQSWARIGDTRATHPVYHASGRIKFVQPQEGPAVTDPESRECGIGPECWGDVMHAAEKIGSAIRGASQ